MTDAELATFIPLYGDRMAVSGLCRDKKGASKKDKKKKSSLMDKLRPTVNDIKGNASSSGDGNDEVDDADSSFENSRRKKLKGNKNAEKTTRMIELSCYHLGEVTVEFFESSGFTRSPIAHTCDRVLKVPSTYENYPSIRCEFNNLLSSKIWVMDIV